MAPVSSHLLPTYARVDIAFERGEGVWLVATNGDRYLDFTSGIAVNLLGHAHPQLVAALTEQAQKLWHVSNLYRIPEGERLADRLCAASFADKVFFTNSGAEAMECSIKMARKYQSVSGKPERFRMITFEGAFHGRTLATLAAGGQKKYLDGFGPVVEGFDQLVAGDIDAVKRAITPETAAIVVEPIQAEGGVRVISPQFLRACASFATSMACSWYSTRCRPASGAPASCSPINAPGSRPTSWRSPRASAAATRWAPALPPPRPRRA
jgi:acetylornithine/N-succinyldiaminopimelate aminotransferase